MKNEKLFKTAVILFKLVSILFAGLSIYWLYLKLTNHSPTVQDIILAIVIMHISISVPLFVHIYYSLGEIKTTISYEFREMERRLIRIEKEI